MASAVSSIPNIPANQAPTTPPQDGTTDKVVRRACLVFCAIGSAIVLGLGVALPVGKTATSEGGHTAAIVIGSFAAALFCCGVCLVPNTSQRIVYDARPGERVYIDAVHRNRFAPDAELDNPA